MKRLRRSAAASIVVEPHRGERIVAFVSMQIGIGADGQLGSVEISLLQRIDELGSLASACRTMNMSYRRGWQYIQSLNELFSLPLVVLGCGGRNGGGSHLTPFGKNLVGSFRQIERKSAALTQLELKTLLGSQDHPVFLGHGRV